MHGYKWPINCTRTRTVPAGRQGIHTVLSPVVRAGQELRVVFRSQWYASKFRAERRVDCGAEAACQSKEVVGLQEYPSHVYPQTVVLTPDPTTTGGSSSCQFQCVWDNSASWMTPLQLWYTLTVHD